MRPSIANAAHFTHGDSAGGTVSLVGAPPSSIHVQKDLLTVGPCDADPARHQARRRAHWNLTEDVVIGDPGAIAAALPSDSPIVLWATLAWSDQLCLWWMLDAFARSGTEVRRLWLAQPVGPPLVSVGGVTNQSASDAIAQAQPISDEQLQEGALLWRKYAASSPLAFDEARRAGSPHFPALTQTAEVHGWWFPRLIDGKLRLAELDELILSSLADEWRTPADLLRTDRGTEIRERLFLTCGDLYLLRRLQDWVQHGGVETKADGGTNPWTSVAYRLTDKTRSLVADGLRGVDDAPALFVGGCRVNDPTAPWLRVIDSGGWRLVARS